MNHYLIIAMDMNTTPPGVVFKTLARAVRSHANLTIVCPDTDPGFDWEGIKLIQPKHYHEHSWKTVTRFWRMYHTNPDDNRWVRKAFRAVWPEVKKESYSAVLVFTSMCYFPSLELGRRIAARLNLPWYIYSVDCIPAPMVWLEDTSPKVHKRITSALDKTCSSASAFFSSNPFMAEYQKRSFPSFKGKWSYLYTPHLQTFSYPKTQHEGLHFLYTGNLYGLRRIDGLLEGFEAFAKDNPGAKLTFVGNFAIEYQNLAKPLIEKGLVEMLPYSKDLSSFFGNADILLDIAADIPDDVYLSSKIVSYLSIDRPILAISGANSPSRNIMSGIPSIVHASNDGADVLRAIKACVENIGKGIEDRKSIREEVKADNIVRKLLSVI